MSLIESLPRFALDEFGGGNQRGERTDVTPKWALEARNCEFEPGFVRTRKGFYVHSSSNFQESLPVSGFYNHLYAGRSWIFRALKNGATSGYVNWTAYDGSDPHTGVCAFTTAIPGPGTFAGFGRRVYNVLATNTYDNGQLAVVDVVSVTTPQVWMVPLTFSTMGAITITPGGPGSGQVTAGTHQFYLLVQSKTGFITRVSPVNTIAGGVIVPFSSVGAADHDNIAISIAAPGGGWDSNIDNVTLVATTSTNQARRYIVPDSKFTITNPAAPITFTFDIADATLATGDVSTPYENQIYMGLNQSSSSVQPISPYYCFQCGERLGLFYVDPTLGPLMAFSRPNEYEIFELDRNTRGLPGLLKPIAGQWVQGTIYIQSEDGTWAYTDTGGDPVTWPPPRSVDTKIGTSLPYGATVDSTGTGFVAHTTGLYAFAGGQYNQQSIAYYQPTTWDSIDWSDASFSMVDDKVNFRLVISCKNIAGQRKTFSWCYVEGYTPEAVKYSEITLQSRSTNWVGIVKNYGDLRSSQHRSQLWTQSSVSSFWLLCRNTLDTTIFRDTDNGVILGIDSGYRLAFLPPQDREYTVNEHHFGLLRILGNGSWRYRVWGLDDTLSVLASDTNGNPVAIILTDNPAKEITIGYSLVSEAASPEIFPVSVIVDQYFEISHWAHFYKGFSARRGT